MSVIVTPFPRNHHGAFRADMPAPYRPEDVRYFDRLNLAALKTAVMVSRQFTKVVLLTWKAPWLIEDAMLIVSELVTNAVQYTGNMQENPRFTQLGNVPMVSVRLIGLERFVIFEVWDTSQEIPVLKDAGPTDEGGRGLRLVDNLSRRWGYYPTTPGKVVWAELPVYPEEKKPSEPIAYPPPDYDPAVLNRVIEGLKGA